MSTSQTRLTILGGFLGSGKTTILKTLLNKLNSGSRTAVIINDFGEVNIDSMILDRGNYSKKEITGGCICCSLKEKLLDSLLSIVKEEKPEEIFIEATGLAVPWEMKETIEKSFSSEQIRVDQVLVCVDARQFDRFHGPLPIYRRQFEGHPHILMTKSDMHPQDQINDVSENIRRIYPRISGLILTENGEVDRDLLPESAGPASNSSTSGGTMTLMPGLLLGNRKNSHKDSIIQLSFSGSLSRSCREMEQTVQDHCSRILRLKGLIPDEDGTDRFIHFDGEKTEGFDSDLTGQSSRMTLFCLEEFREEMEAVFQEYFE